MELCHNKDFETKLFSKPLIIGASVSAGYGTIDGGPAAVLSKMMNPHSKVTNLAISGATSVRSTSHIDFDSHNPSIVMGFDLFFWDIARQDTGPKFETNTRRLFKSLHTRRIPIIVGKFPVIDFPFAMNTKGIQKSARKVNELLEEICHKDSNTILYDPLSCLLSMKEDHFSDGLHLTPKGNQFCAQFLAESRIYRHLKLANF